MIESVWQNYDNNRSDARVAEEARLESVYTSKAYREFESRSLRKKLPQKAQAVMPVHLLKTMTV